MNEDSSLKYKYKDTKTFLLPLIDAKTLPQPSSQELNQKHAHKLLTYEHVCALLSKSKDWPSSTSCSSSTSWSASSPLLQASGAGSLRQESCEKSGCKRMPVGCAMQTHDTKRAPASPNGTRQSFACTLNQIFCRLPTSGL